jgi:type II secretory pathway predicted ATPase ExeA
MYQTFYGLRELPFELTPNPRFLYLAPRHREALSNLEYGLASGKPVTVLTGEAGTGKTTLIRAALESPACRHIRCVYINNPALKRDEFVQMLAHRFDLSDEAARSKAVMLRELERILYERRARGEVTALVIDEAQALSSELLEEIRLLANIETPTARLLPLVLAGQPELGERLEEPGLRQLKQRIALRCAIEPLDLSETATYIATRIRTAGGEASRLFSREAVMLIHEHSRGIPRLISVLCDNALVSGFALEKQPVGRSVVMEVVKDFHLRSAEPVVAAAAAAETLVDTPVLAVPAPAEPEVADASSPSRELFEEVARTRRFALFRSGRA